MDSNLNYVANPFRSERRATRVVHVGDVAIGGDNPIRVQSMTTTDTLDTQGTADQSARLAAVGCEIVRITAPSIKEAENLAEIAALLKRRGIAVPLVADIHFTPNAAMIAALHVDKVRVNPGNYADRKKFEVREYSDAEYRDELVRVGDRFRPLVRRCRERGVALRIGTNHGSLSDRIMNRYGDTPLGMVESALEFLDVCEEEDYREVIFSMKSSNPQVAIQAYRLLAARLSERAPGEPSYPFHVGVTEAGDGEDGRIKSAIGIGALLEDGIGDTIRVSLTEDPVKEVPVAFALAKRAEARWKSDREAGPGDAAAPAPDSEAIEGRYVEDPFSHSRRQTQAVAAGGLQIGDRELVRVELDVGELGGAGGPGGPGEPSDRDQLERAADLGVELAHSLAARLATAQALQPDLPCEGLRAEVASRTSLTAVGALGAELSRLGLEIPIVVRVQSVQTLATAGADEPDQSDQADETDRPIGASSQREWVEALSEAAGVVRLAVPVRPGDSQDELAAAAAIASQAALSLEWCVDGPPSQVPAAIALALAASSQTGAAGFAMSLSSSRLTHAARIAVASLAARGAGEVPLILRHEGPLSSESEGAGLLAAAVDLGGLLCDGIGDAICVPAERDPATALDLAYRILQGARQRTTRTEYISCPSCGRTQFDLEETTARVKAKTEHLKGVKIAVMGCIVNGPGEMADADFGYVGAGTARVNLYVGKEVVARGVPETEAPERLVEVIRENGAWRDPA